MACLHQSDEMTMETTKSNNDKETTSSSTSSRLSLKGFSTDGAHVEIYIGTVVSPSYYLISPMRSVRMMSPTFPGPVRRVVQIEKALNAATLCPLTKPPQRSDLVAVEASSSDWRRGRVFKVPDDRRGLFVFLVDTGNIVEVSEEQLRVLPEDLACPPFLAQKLVITDIEPLGENGVSKEWSPSATNLVRELVLCAHHMYMFLPNFKIASDVIVSGDMFIQLPEGIRGREERIVQKYARLIDGLSVASISNILVNSGYAAKYNSMSDGSSFNTPSVSSLRHGGSTDISEPEPDDYCRKVNPIQVQEASEPNELLKHDVGIAHRDEELKNEAGVNCDMHRKEEPNVVADGLPDWLHPVLLTTSNCLRSEYVESTEKTRRRHLGQSSNLQTSAPRDTLRPSVLREIACIETAVPKCRMSEEMPESTTTAALPEYRGNEEMPESATNFNHPTVLKVLEEWSEEDRNLIPPQTVSKTRQATKKDSAPHRTSYLPRNPRSEVAS